MDMEVNDFHREDHYLAQIAACVLNAIPSKNKKVIGIDDMLIKFVKEEKEKKLKGRDKMNAAKRFFIMGVGLKSKG